MVGATPHESLLKRAVTLSVFRNFGCRVWIHSPGRPYAHHQKLSLRGVPGRFLGLERPFGSNVVLLLLNDGRATQSQTVVFADPPVVLPPVLLPAPEADIGAVGGGGSGGDTVIVMTTIVRRMHICLRLQCWQRCPRRRNQRRRQLHHQIPPWQPRRTRLCSLLQQSNTRRRPLAARCGLRRIPVPCMTGPFAGRRLSWLRCRQWHQIVDCRPLQIATWHEAKCAGSLLHCRW